MIIISTKFQLRRYNYHTMKPLADPEARKRGMASAVALAYMKV